MCRKAAIRVVRLFSLFSPAWRIHLSVYQFSFLSGRWRFLPSVSASRSLDRRFVLEARVKTAKDLFLYESCDFNFLKAARPDVGQWTVVRFRCTE